VNQTLRVALRVLAAVPLFLFSSGLMAITAVSMAVADLLTWWRGHDPLPAPTPADARAASIVIPNWNGRELLEKYLPSVIAAAAANPEHEVIVVDNGSTDGSAEFIRGRFPSVRVLALETNLGFGGGANAGVRAARNDVVVLLNSDMRVAEDFLAPLLGAFKDSRVFAVACQILFSDPAKRREETGLTEGRWRRGSLWVSHREDPEVSSAFPCFYAGGGSSAFDRRKFLELGGFDELLAPFYFEDTDLGFLAWKRGWAVLYEPRSLVWHEHRGTIGRTFSEAFIVGVLGKNRLLFCWKNIHEWPRMLQHLIAAAAKGARRRGAVAAWRAFRQLPAALKSRARARSLAAVSDTEAFLRPIGAWCRDRFDAVDPFPKVLSVLFVAPYPICPPVHGGAVFMYHMVRELARLCELHLLIVLDHPAQRQAHRELEEIAASVIYYDRTPNPRKQLTWMTPHAVHEIAHAELAWLLQREVWRNRVDVIQLEYTSMAQYGMALQRMACVLFEHDVYFQSVGRALSHTARNALAKAMFEYLRALRYETRVLRRFDRVQVCSAANADYLLSFAPALQGRLDDNLRAGIDVASYPFQLHGREPLTMLFLGNFRHRPNVWALEWFLDRVLPRVVAVNPDARLVVAGSEMPPGLVRDRANVEVLGFVPDIAEVLGRYAVFVCPILSGSGVRVKLLEAFACGIPVVSTRLGAEGLAEKDGEYCRLVDDPKAFAEAIAEIFADPQRAGEMAARARTFVEAEKNTRVLAPRLVESWRETIESKRPARYVGSTSPRRPLR
jgi:GT2 family glycosyltransferase/glycosyltransferase involved in cell wall biosynthesis